MGKGIYSSAIQFFVKIFFELKFPQCMFNDSVSGH